MKQTGMNRMLSILLVAMMLVGLLPLSAFAGTTYVKLGDISQVTVNAILNPTPGGRNFVEKWEIGSPVDHGVGSQGGWQRWNETAETWEQYGAVSHPVMEEGVYRYHVQIRTDKNEANEYYALTEDAALYVNGVQWTKGSKSFMYESNGYGLITYVSPSFVVSEDSGNGGRLLDLVVTTPPTRTEYLEGEYFDTAGMEVTAFYDNSATVPVRDYLVTDGMTLAEGQTTVTIRYTEGGVTKTAVQEITVTAEAPDEKVFEVSSWEDFQTAFDYSSYRGEDYTIRLMQDLRYNAENVKRNATAIMNVEVKGCNVTLDFNGHTLSCVDTVSKSDLQSPLSDFIRIVLHPVDFGVPVVFRLTDSVGGGGVSMTSHRAYDNQLAALHIVDARNYMIGNLYQSCPSSAVLIIDGGTYSLDAKTEKIGRGTCEINTFYRGTVIADAAKHVEINGGTFKATSDGCYRDGDDFCARELSAFATCSNASENSGAVEYEYTVINGGTFISDGYAIHHFDHSMDVDKTMSMRFPFINGGVFAGAVGYVGMSYTYENWDTTGYGMKEYKEMPASAIINSDARVMCIKNGRFCDFEDLTVGDLHESDSLCVFSDSLFHFKTRPVTGDSTELERYVGQQEAFEVVYEVPFGVGEGQITPYISVTPNGGTTTTEEIVHKDIRYQDYPDGLTVTAGIAFIVAGETVRYENTYIVTVTDIPAPAEIVSQPTSMSVKPGEYAEATVVADHAAAYQWYYMFDGMPMALTDDLVSMLNTDIEGYTSATLRMALDSVAKEQFYCEVTGTDGTKKKTDRIYFTYGAAPSVSAFGGGDFYAGWEAEFKLFAMYADEITWYVMKRRSGSLKVYTLDEFAELTGCEYGVSHRSYRSGMHQASLLFRHVDESWAGTYCVGYQLENTLGKISFDPEQTLPFTLSVTRPDVRTYIETQSCPLGETLTFTFEADDMSSAEWHFEKADSDGVAVAYTLEKMKAMFPDTVFEPVFLGDAATLTIRNACAELCEYTLYARAVGVSASSPAGSAQCQVVFGVVIGDVNLDGVIDMVDAFQVYAAASTGNIPENVQTYADMNGDGVIDMVDAFQVYRIASGA